MRLSLPYGDSALEVALPDDNVVGVIGATEASEAEGAARRGGARPPSEQEIVARALRAPIGAPPLGELAEQVRSAAVVVSDATRPCPTHTFLPALLAELAPIPPQKVSILFALGSHRQQTREEQVALVGEEVMRGYPVFDLDEHDCVALGETSIGTPLEVFRPYVEADLRICTGNLEYHYFAGYSGGAKAVMPGVCTRKAIQPNHSLMLSPRAKAGIYEGNPVRADIDEAGAIVGVDYIFNVALDEHRHVIDAVAGHYLEAHREGIRRYDDVFDLTIPEAVDVVVASPGGHPKDMNLYQAQKTLDNVRLAVREGGVIVLVARCAEGLGQRVFEEWITQASSPQAVIARLQREFVLGGHKAAAIADLLQTADVHLVSAMPDDAVRAVGMQPYRTVEDAVAAALARLGSGVRILVVAHGDRVRALDRA